MCEHEVKKLPFVIRFVPDRYKTQQMYFSNQQKLF